MDALVALIADIGGRTAGGRARRRVWPPRGRLQRQAQFLLDFVEAENSNGFHAPQEAVRILGQAVDIARQGQLSLRPAVKPSSQ